MNCDIAPNHDLYQDCKVKACRNDSNSCRPECDNADCMYDSGLCLNYTTCSIEVQCQSRYRDGLCDPMCDNPKCGFDIDCFDDEQPDQVNFCFFI